MTVERELDAREARRLAAEDRFLGRLEKREAEAEKMIGTLMRSGKTVFYVWPAGRKYREGTEDDLIRFLIRNKYA